jgi:hypothetical protein
MVFVLGRGYAALYCRLSKSSQAAEILSLTCRADPLVRMRPPGRVRHACGSAVFCPDLLTLRRFWVRSGSAVGPTPSSARDPPVALGAGASRSVEARNGVRSWSRPCCLVGPTPTSARAPLVALRPGLYSDGKEGQMSRSTFSLVFGSIGSTRVRLSVVAQWWQEPQG